MSDTTFSFLVDEQLKEQFLRLAANRDVNADQLIREFMRDCVEQEDPVAYDSWFRRQVQAGLDSLNSGKEIPAEEVEAEFAAKRAETRRKLGIR
jgi:predicted transcriptional regulator